MEETEQTVVAIDVGTSKVVALIGEVAADGSVNIIGKGMKAAQGIKKGVLELADVIAVNKADGPHAGDARTAAGELAGALRLLRSAEDPSAANRSAGDRSARTPTSG